MKAKLLRKTKTLKTKFLHHIQIISYPSFQVKISKPSGRTLHFNALYNKLSEEEGSNDPEEQFDLIRFDSLKIYNQSESMEDVYEAETENMDGVSKVVLFRK